MTHAAFRCALLAAACLLGAAAIPVSAAEPSMAETAAAAPTRFSVEVVGSGPDVILIPGLSSPRDVWAATAARLAPTHRVHLIQVRGFGEPAGANGSGPVLTPFVAELEDYIRANKLKGAAIVGHSMGGLAALMLGTRSPDLPGKIMVVDALPFIGVLFDPAGTRATVADIEPRAARMRAMLLSSAEQQQIDFARPAPDCAAQVPNGPIVGNLSNSPVALCRIGHWSQQSDLHVVAQAMYDDMVTDVRADLPKLRAPVTMLYPQDDRLTSAEEAEALYTTAYANSPDTVLIPVRGSYHFIMLDQPAAFNKALDTFLADPVG